MALLVHSGSSAWDLGALRASTGYAKAPRPYHYLYDEARINRESWRFILVFANAVFSALLAAVLAGWVR